MSNRPNGKPTGTQPSDLLPDYRKAVAKAADRLRPILDQEFDRQMTTKHWYWDNDTLRKNKQFIKAGLRDIVDLGKLIGSKRYERLNPSTLQWTWGGGDVKYAAVVHDGPQAKQGFTYAGRPWTTHAVQELNVDKILTDIIRKELDG